MPLHYDDFKTPVDFTFISNKIYSLKKKNKFWCRKVNIDELKTITKDRILAQAKTLTADDTQLLIDALNEKDDKLRYNAFLLLQAYSTIQPHVYGFWDVLEKKLDSDNSYQRSLGVMLIADNVRWDKEGKFAKALGKYMACCNDEKFITARQTIQAIERIVAATDKYNKLLEQGLVNLQFSKYKENQQKLLKKDVAVALKLIKK